ncbi:MULTISPECIES: gamma-glutamylcyclotransferase family protein [unclassified Variovorax]|uniref:gamma-glutamylcyclotransferase family protein n=1 Tax=unclassified Variovorax TaxID=663243 RepID=UPI0008CB6881|nr:MULTISPECIES: gamma-glutamylcyclotransferase family protein [unclassified Variovorax]SEK16225.1 gamma-glutamylcyclotransferase [Variovorax sp. OK202]SFE42179.1 gamma-glutamylcyclotransferase [Variovorax sp. OK212]
MTADRFLYFAYGSNMSSRCLRAANRAPSALVICSASLAGYRLVFEKVSKDGSSKADCRHTGDPHDQVYGALFSIAETDAAALDLAEGALGSNPGYRRAEAEVMTSGGPQRARTYFAVQKREGLLPYPWYVQHVLAGAMEFALPSEYVERIERQETMPDADANRSDTEFAVYL